MVIVFESLEILHLLVLSNVLIIHCMRVLVFLVSKLEAGLFPRKCSRFVQTHAVKLEMPFNGVFNLSPSVIGEHQASNSKFQFFFLNDVDWGVMYCSSARITQKYANFRNQNF